MVLWVVVAVVCVWRWWKRVIIQLKKKIKKSTQKEEKTKNKEEEDSEYLLNGRYLARHVFHGVLFVKYIIIIYFYRIRPIYIIGINTLLVLHFDFFHFGPYILILPLLILQIN